MEFTHRNFSQFQNQISPSQRCERLGVWWKYVQGCLLFYVAEGQTLGLHIVIQKSQDRLPHILLKVHSFYSQRWSPDGLITSKSPLLPNLLHRRLSPQMNTGRAQTFRSQQAACIQDSEPSGMAAAELSSVASSSAYWQHVQLEHKEGTRQSWRSPPPPEEEEKLGVQGAPGN